MPERPPFEWGTIPDPPKGLDPEALAEWYFRAAFRRGIAARLRTKSRLLNWVVLRVISIEYGLSFGFTRYDIGWRAGKVTPAVLLAWRRLCAAGVVCYTPRQPLRVIHA